MTSAHATRDDFIERCPTVYQGFLTSNRAQGYWQRITPPKNIYGYATAAFVFVCGLALSIVFAMDPLRSSYPNDVCHCYEADVLSSEE